MTERERIIESLSDSELLLWQSKFGIGDLPPESRRRLERLIAEMIGKKMPPPDPRQKASRTRREKPTGSDVVDVDHDNRLMAKAAELARIGLLEPPAKGRHGHEQSAAA